MTQLVELGIRQAWLRQSLDYGTSEFGPRNFLYLSVVSEVSYEAKLIVSKSERNKTISSSMRGHSINKPPGKSMGFFILPNTYKS